MSSDNPFYLLTKIRFLPLFCTQFLGALNDSLYRNALIILLAFTASHSVLNQDTLVNLCAAIFVIPYFLFSALAGQFADKFEKSLLIRLIKWAEVFLAALAVLGFYWNNLFLLLTALFLLGTQATFFGPIKYSILPQHLKDTELVTGNGLIEMGTFIAILLGTLLGGILVAIPETGLVWISVTMGMLSIAGLGSSLFIPKADPYTTHLTLNWNPIALTASILKTAYNDQKIFYAILGISWFWLYGSMFITQLPNFTKLVLGGNEHVATLLLISFSVGIGIGSMLCARLSNHKIELGLVPYGALGLSLFAFDFSFAHGDLPTTVIGGIEFLQHVYHWRVLFDASWMGIAGGFFLVPLYSFIQKQAVPEERSRMIAANNIINAIFMTSASVIAIFFLNIGFSIPQLFLITALLNAIVTILIFIRIPEFWIRSLFLLKQWTKAS